VSINYFSVDVLLSVVEMLISTNEIL